MKIELSLSQAALKAALVNLGQALPTQVSLDVAPDTLTPLSRSILADKAARFEARATDAPQYRLRVWRVNETTFVHESSCTVPYYAPLYPQAPDQWDTLLADFAREYDATRTAQQANNATVKAREDAKKAREQEIKNEAMEKALAIFMGNPSHQPAALNPPQLFIYKPGTFPEKFTIPNDHPAYQEAIRRGEAREREDDAKKQAQEQAEETAKAERLAARHTWISEHGSPYLQKAEGAGYNCQRVYITERAALEYPAYAVDFSDDAQWKDRACPSEAALDEALRVGGEVVWMTDPGKTLRKTWDMEEGEWGEDPFTPCEAVTLKFLDKYDLVKRF